MKTKKLVSYISLFSLIGTSLLPTTLIAHAARQKTVNREYQYHQSVEQDYLGNISLHRLSQGDIGNEQAIGGSGLQLSYDSNGRFYIDGTTESLGSFSYTSPNIYLSDNGGISHDDFQLTVKVRTYILYQINYVDENGSTLQSGTEQKSYEDGESVNLKSSISSGGATYLVSESQVRISAADAENGKAVYNIKCRNQSGGGSSDGSGSSNGGGNSSDSYESGWKQDSHGWWYLKSDGSYYKNEWVTIDGISYYFNEEGYLEEGGKSNDSQGGIQRAHQDDSQDNNQGNQGDNQGNNQGENQGDSQSEEYQEQEADGNSSGEGWKHDGVGWWYQKSDGSYYTNEWVLISYKWYYFEANGYAASNGWKQIGGKWYYFNSDCAILQNEWVQDGGEWYWLSSDGSMTVNSWLESGGKYYYLGSDGKMLRNALTPDGYYVDNDGVWN